MVWKNQRCTRFGWCHANTEDRWPLPNVWLGVSAEDQKTADERIPLLLQTPAAVRFVSYEPALGPVDFSPWLRPAGFEHQWLDWIIVGGESQAQARGRSMWTGRVRWFSSAKRRAWRAL